MENKPLGTKFWSRWLKANELDKLKIIEELPLFKGRHIDETPVSSTLFNSYLVDAVDAERNRIAKRLHDEGQPWIDCNISYFSVSGIEEALIVQEE